MITLKVEPSDMIDNAKAKNQTQRASPQTNNSSLLVKQHECGRTLFDYNTQKESTGVCIM